MICDSNLSHCAMSRINISSFCSLYDQYFEPVCQFLEYYTRDVAAIEDVVQDVFVSLWENKDYLEIQYVKTYLFNAARNRILNYLRNNKNREALLSDWIKKKEMEESSTDCYDIEEFSTLLNKAIDLLPDRCREIFILSKIEKLTYQQIAEYLLISPKTVEIHMSNALKRIRESISSYYLEV
jgi:RNA polymerase sigma-70 factor (family 1)